MIRIGDIATPRQDHSNVGDKTSGKPKVSDQKEKAPKLGAGNAFLIGLKAAFKSLTNDSSYSTIRNELKKVVIQDKKDKIASQGELRDSQNAREMKMDSKPSRLIDFKTQAETSSKDKTIAREINPAEVEKFFFPEVGRQRDTKYVTAFFTNMISKFQNEMANKGNQPQDNLKNFKELASLALKNVANVNNMSSLDPNIFKMAAQEFAKDFRTESQSYMDALHDIMSGMKNPTSDISKEIKKLGLDQVKSQYDKLSGSGGGFIRDKGVDAFNLHILNNGGEKFQSEARNFMSTHSTNIKFIALDNSLKQYEETTGTKAEFKKGIINKDGVQALGSMAIEVIRHIKNNGITDDLKKTLSEIKDVFIQDVVAGTIQDDLANKPKLSKSDAIEALRILGDSSMVLRFVNPEVYGRSAGRSHGLLALSQFLQMVTIEGKPDPNMPEDAKQEYANQLSLIKVELNGLTSAMGLPTLEEFGKQIDTAIRKTKEGVEEMPGLKDPKELAELYTEMDDMQTLDQFVEDEKIRVDPETAHLQKLSDKGLLPKDDGTDNFADILGEITPEQQKQLDEYNRIADLRIEELTNEVNELLGPKEKITENKTN